MRPARQGLNGGARSVALVDRPVPAATAQAVPTSIEGLSPLRSVAEDDVEAAEPTQDECEIECWRGYVKSQFYVASDRPLEPAITSPFFRAGGGAAPERTETASQAYRELVEKLAAAGWIPAGHGDHWFSQRFRRASA